MMRLFDSDLDVQMPMLSQLDPNLEGGRYGTDMQVDKKPIDWQPDDDTSNGYSNSNGSNPNGSKGHNGSSNHPGGNGNSGKVALASENPDSLDLSEKPAPEVEETTHGFWPVLKIVTFSPLERSGFSQLADKVYLVLMIALIASRFQSEGQTISGWVSSIMIAFTIPAVLFGSVAGVYVDRWSKKTVLVATNLLRGGLVLILPPLLWISQGWSPFAGLPIGFYMLLGITFLVSTLTQFFAPAEQAVIPLIVERKHLLSANSLYTTTMMASVIIGFAVGEPLLQLADRLVAWLSGNLDIGKEVIVGASYAIAGLLLLLLKTGEKGDHLEQQEPPHVWQDIKDGLRYLGQQGRVRAALIQLVVLFSIFAALAVLAVRLAEIMPAIKSSQFGFLLAAGGIGMGIGATILGYFGQRFSRAQLALCGSIGMSASLAAIPLFAWELVPTLLMLVAMGGFAAIVGIPMQTAIQEETPEEMRGKVFGLQNNAVNIALSLPLALAGVAETLFGLQVVFVGLAVMAIAGGTLTWYISREGSPKTPQ
ncbi:MAG: MFS transporter [Leptolyngbyaceae cyanobacterium RM2_2_4]|nr:MFS transporter [Leptolyngbyaceae cyanobacterium RM2_2_4]